MTDQRLLECQRYIAYVKHIQVRLDQLATDLEIRQSLQHPPYYFAVDFAELMAFAFPLSSSHHIQMMPDESTCDAFSREIAVLSFVLSHQSERILSITKNLLILPPYIEEMRAELALIRNRLIEVNNLVSVLQGVQNTVFVSGRYRDRGIAGIVEEFEERRGISEGSWRIVAEHLQKSYNSYLAIIVSSAYGGAPFLKRLIDDKVIRGWRTYFRQRYEKSALDNMGLKVFSGNKIEHRLYEYTRRLCEIQSRRTEKKRVPNVTDAAACIMLSDLNKILCEEQSCVILISHSRAMAVAADSVCLRVGGEYRTIPGVRDLDYFWLYYVNMCLHSSDQGLDTMLREIREMNRTMCMFIESFDAVCEDSDRDEAAMKQVTDQLSDVKKYMGYLSNVSLAAQTDETLLSFLQDMSAGRRTLTDSYERREMAKRMLDILTDREMVKVLGSKKRELSGQIREIADLLQQTPDIK